MKKIQCALFLIMTVLCTQLNSQPKLTLVIIIDQFAEKYLKKLDPYLSHGLHHLLKHGIVYTNAYLPYGGTSTAVGHTSLGTGALPSDHGIIYNEWYDQNNNKIEANTPATVSLIMAPTLSQHFIHNNNNKSLAISYKDRAALGLSGKASPAIWFDDKTKEFKTNTHSHAFDTLVTNFNIKLKHLNPITWNLAHKENLYYQFPHINDYRYTRDPSMIGKTITRIEEFKKTPQANKLLFDMAYTYIKENLPTLTKDGHMLVFISASSLDKIGHIYGPHSMEIIDMIYHLDKQIEIFIDQLAQLLSPKETLFILTADHGVMPVPEIAKKKHPTARRMSHKEFIKNINNYAKKQFGITSLVLDFECPHLFLDKFTLNSHNKDEILQKLSTFIETLPGITHVYIPEKLHATEPVVGSIPWLLKNSIYNGRSGDLLIETEPYVLIGDKLGTKHSGPYPYNTHIPLILYQPGKYENKTISDRVWMPQVTKRLAKILHIKPTPFMLDAIPV